MRKCSECRRALVLEIWDDEESVIYCKAFLLPDYNLCDTLLIKIVLEDDYGV